MTLTDLPEALPLLRLNINENKTKIGSMGGYATAESLVWGDNTSEILKEEFDMIVMADCVYYEEVTIFFIRCIFSVKKLAYFLCYFYYQIHYVAGFRSSYTNITVSHQHYIKEANNIFNSRNARL